MTPGDSDELAINIEKLVVDIQGHRCLDIPSLKVKRGAAILVQGENGSGKTTLLRVISGLIQPVNGKLKVLGEDLNALPPGQKDQFRADHIGFIFQRFNLLPYLPALDNILLPCGFSKTRKAQVLSQGTTAQFEAYQLMARLKLEDPSRLRVQTGKLSLGLQQRVAIARALIGQPGLILADEPAASLDSGSRQLVYELLLSICKETNATLICISHDNQGDRGFDQVLSMSDINCAAELNPLW